MSVVHLHRSLLIKRCPCSTSKVEQYFSATFAVQTMLFCFEHNETRRGTGKPRRKKIPPRGGKATTIEQKTTENPKLSSRAAPPPFLSASISQKRPQVFINVALATNNAVDPSRRATLNGLSMTLGSLAKAGGPAFFSAVFAWSIDGGKRAFPLDYHLVFYLLSLRYLTASSFWVYRDG